MTERDLAAQLRRLGVGLGALVLAGGVLGACSSSKSSSSTSGTSGAGSASSGTSKAGSSDPARQIQDLSSSVQAAEHATFKAVYKLTSNGSSQSVTVEQKPPKSALISSDGKLINDGTKSYYCSTQNGSTTCLAQSAGNPLGAIAAVFSPSTAVAALQQAQAQVAARVAGYKADFSTESFAGQSSNCVTITSAANTGKYCVTKDGILAYSGSAGSSFELTDYSKDVPDSEFALPAGATTVTLPGG